jgi:hypothetical protein
MSGATTGPLDRRVRCLLLGRSKVNAVNISDSIEKAEEKIPGRLRVGTKHLATD